MYLNSILARMEKHNVTTLMTFKLNVAYNTSPTSFCHMISMTNNCVHDIVELTL